MSCKLTASVNGRTCVYTVAGARRLTVANWARPVELAGASIPEGGEVPVLNQIGYRRNIDGQIISIVLPAGESLYEMPVADLSLNYIDALLVGANNTKYRQHTVNAVLNGSVEDMLTTIDPLSLGKFVAFITRKDGITKVLGRINGLQAPANGADESTGTAEADASGVVLILQGTSNEVAPIVESEAIIDPLVDVITIEP